MSKRILVIADPIEGWNRLAETSFFLTAEACRRGDKIFLATLNQLSFREGKLLCEARPFEVAAPPSIQEEFSFQWTSKSSLSEVSTYDAVLLRKDPPVTMTYVHHLQLMTLLETSIRFCNQPSSVLRWNEKLAILRFPQWISPTVVRLSGETQASDFSPMIRKNLDDAQGRGVRLLKTKKEISQEDESDKGDYILEQPFNPRVSEGDKRVLLFGGKVAGYFVRVPKQGQYLSNMRHGATVQPCELTKREKSIVDEVARWSQEQNLFLVGLDLIGENLSEVNCTSVRGIREFMQAGGPNLSGLFWDQFWKQSIGSPSLKTL